MNPNPEPQNPGGADNEWLSEEEFAKWLKADPKNDEEWSYIVNRAAQDESLAPELRASAQKAVAKRHEARSIKTVQDKFKALMAVIHRPPGTMLAEERMAQCNALMNEITDALLETPEPHRTNYLKQVLPLREQMRAIKIPG